MRFRTIVFLSVAGIVSAVVAAATTTAVMVVGREARRQLETELAHEVELFGSLVDARMALLRVETRVVADEPRIKAVVATGNVDHETVLGVARDLRVAAQCDLMLIVDAQSRLLADVADPAAEGASLEQIPLIREAFANGEAMSLWSDDSHHFMVVARRLSFATTTAGVLVMGYLLDDRFAEEISQQTHGIVAVADTNRVFAIAGPMTAETRVSAQTALAGRHHGLNEVSLHGSVYLALVRPWTTLESPSPPTIVVARSLDEALAPSRRLTQALLIILAAGIAIAMGFTFLLSRRITRSLEALASAAHAIGAGDLAHPIAPKGPREVRMLGQAMSEMTNELGRSREELVSKERMARELEIGTRIQAAILPQEMTVAGLELAAKMWPASEVGGDYYDVIPLSDGGWIGIGDVAGHGLSSGLVMLMVQSVVSSLARGVDLSPRQAIVALNRVIYDNVRHRLRQDDHVTLTLLRYYRDGRLIYAGAHEEILVCRATGGVERWTTPGTWIGAVEDVTPFTTDTEKRLHDGDVALLYSDGLIEAMDTRHTQFGIDRVSEILMRNHNRDVATIRDLLWEAMSQFTTARADDVTILVLRYRAPA